MDITIYTASVTRDTIDPDGTIAEAHWERERERYIDMQVAAAQAAYPEAEVDTQPGNGIESIAVSGDDGMDDDATRRDLEDTLRLAYQQWCETVPNSAYHNPDASRHLTIQVRVNDYERARIEELATPQHLTVAEYVRQRALAD